MAETIDLLVRRARESDVEALMRLYFEVYGPTYPLAFATHRDRALATVRSDAHLWLVAELDGQLAGSVLFEIDRLSKLGKVAGLVVHPGRRKCGAASRLVHEGVRRLLEDPAGESLNSIYTTTRTNTAGPQVIFLRAGFAALGIFPNAHKLGTFETLTLFVKHRPGTLARRASTATVPEKLLPLLEALETSQGLATPARAVPSSKLDPAGPPLEFELVVAPEYVRRRFEESVRDPYDRFYPFHVPNLLMASTNGEVEIYAYFSRPDRYCTLVSVSVPCHRLAGRLQGLMSLLRDHGVSYLEILFGLEHTRSIEALLDAQFLPSAIYPALRESLTLRDEAGKPLLNDFVVLSRSLEPLNFQGMEIDRAFKPFIDQYVSLWKRMHLETLEVFS